MLIIISAVIILVISLFIAKRIFTKQLQVKYEESLLKGNRKKADKLGRIYYLSLDEENRKAKGVVDIEAKISDDFRSFNSHRFSFLL
ncbi:MAG: hypothetical protein JWN83_2733 [Chitinophagaceae bacterium]|nr:hypothetical protein [Chitinophagaceae bacterium]